MSFICFFWDISILLLVHFLIFLFLVPCAKYFLSHRVQLRSDILTNKRRFWLWFLCLFRNVYESCRSTSRSCLVLFTRWWKNNRIYLAAFLEFHIRYMLCLNILNVPSIMQTLLPSGSQINLRKIGRIAFDKSVL